MKIAPGRRDAAPPLSFAQQRMWVLQQLAPDTFAYNMPMRLRLDGDLNIHTLEQTLGEVLRRHEVLRTVFAAPNGSPVPVVYDPERWRLPIET